VKRLAFAKQNSRLKLLIREEIGREHVGLKSNMLQAHYLRVYSSCDLINMNYINL